VKHLALDNVAPAPEAIPAMGPGTKSQQRPGSEARPVEKTPQEFSVRARKDLRESLMKNAGLVSASWASSPDVQACPKRDVLNTRLPRNRR
jgi:hypothetical protein